jgi:biopolymer transport protein ExbB
MSKRNVDRPLALLLLCILAIVVGLTAPAANLHAEGEAAAGEHKSSGKSPAAEIMNFLVTSLIGWALMGTYFLFIAMAVWLFIDIRGGALMPVDLIEALEDAAAKRRLKEGFDLAKDDPTMFGRVMAAGMTRLQHGIEESREAVHAMLASLAGRKKGVLQIIAVIGTLGPLIGLVGTVQGMIESFGVIGSGDTPKPQDLANGISHALNATLVGIFLAVLAIPMFTLFNSRLDRLTADVGLMADDLLTQMYYNTRPGAPAPSGSAVTAPPNATQPMPARTVPAAPATPAQPRVPPAR